MEPAKKQLKPLTEIFPDPEELDLAAKLVEAVPEDIGPSPFWKGTISDIIYTAFPFSEKSDAEWRALEKFVISCRILERMAEEGYIRRAGNCGGGYNPLYEKP